MLDAEKVLGKERLNWERSQYKSKPKNRLTLNDFEAIGVNIPEELWKGLQQIENPVEYMKMFVDVLGFIVPKVNTIDIQQEITAQGDIPKLDLSGVSSQNLVDLLRSEK